ncbi:hypothetical protein AB0N24_22775 [Arthrobacter sp. NPDC093128]|uniref:hypothetical protein n=1 Tax=Arthrobacter sp. NPDC093128 TaxID=3154979 RepID=UPI0034379EC8
MNEPTGSRPDAAGTIFNLPSYRVIDAVDLPEGRRVTVAPTDPPGCPERGVMAKGAGSRRLQRNRDIPVAGAVEVMWAKRRWFCIEIRCARGTFAESTEQVPRFARSAQRLKETVVSAVVERYSRAADELEAAAREGLAALSARRERVRR